jgi:methionyl-tRNA formyltransferase
VLQPGCISAPQAIGELLGYRPDVLVVCAYGQILRQDVLDAVLTIVVHPSLAPHWRGAAPVARALMAGETELAVTVLKMSAGVDEGPVGDVRRVMVPADADAGRAFELLGPAAVEGVLATLEAIAAGSIVWREQEGEPTYAAKITAEDRLINWSRPPAAIVNRVRALSPEIGAVTELLGKRTLVWRAAVGQGPLPAPASGRLGLPAGDGWVEILELQQEGRARMSAAEFLRGAGRALTSR